MPVGGAERGLAEPRHQPEVLEEEVGGEVLVYQWHVRCEAPQVGAGAEDLFTRPGEDDGSHGLVVAGVLDRFHQPSEQLSVEGVALIGAVQRDRRHPVLDVIEELVRHRPAQRSGTRSKWEVLRPTAYSNVGIPPARTPALGQRTNRERA